MKLLVLGGTVFLGRHLVEAALGRGYEVTLFNRGRTNPDLFPGVERLAGDRDGGLELLAGRRWDAVVDTSGYVPRVVRQSAELLSGSGFYAFVSTASVYPIHSPDKSEEGPVERLDDPATEEVTAHYGGLKALCEEVVTDMFGPRALLVRSGLIVGPFDRTGRFTYWAVRLGRPGEVLAPGAPERPVQFIDARDQAAWILDMAEAGRGGTFNVTGPTRPLTFGELLGGHPGPVTWVPDQFLLDEGVKPWTELPLWIPPPMGDLNMPVERAVAAGLRCRGVDETVRDTRAWAAAQSDHGLPAQVTPEREAELLERWHARVG
jgi:2'-hydroxyisoflavone reductase